MRTHRSRRATRHGFTLVELIVAIMILTVGVLGLASTAAVVSRQTGGGTQQTIAANIASSRFERLRGRSCSAIVAWTAPDPAMPGIEERGNPTKPASNNLRPVIDSVRYTAGGGRKSQWLVFNTLVPCTSP